MLRGGTGIPLTIEEAEAYFNSIDCAHEFSADSFHIQSLDPIWAFALPIQVNGQAFHVVPVSNDLDSLFPNSDYNLLFFRDTSGSVHFNLFISTSTTGTLAASVDDMTGFWLQISEENKPVSGYAIQEGYAIPFGVEFLTQFQNPTHSELRGGGPKCPGFGGGFDWDLFWIKLNSGWNSFWENIWEYFEDNWGGGSSSGGSSITFMDPNQSSNSGIFWSWSGAGTGAWTSSGPSGTTPLNIQGLFNNDLFNRGFRSLRKCAGEAEDGGQNATDDQQALAMAMAEVMGNADQFHHVFSIAMDMYLEAMQSGNGTVQLSDLFLLAADPLYYFNPYTFNHINSDQSILPSAYLYHEMAWFYKSCRLYDGPIGAGNGVGLDDAICSCMAQQTVENAIRDYILQYASAANNPNLPVSMSQTERDNWQLLKDLNNSFDLSTEDLLALSFTPFKPAESDYAANAKAFVANKLHSILKNEYCDVYTWGESDLENLLNQENGADKFMAAFVLFTSYVDGVGDPPTDPYMWQLMMETFAEDLGPILLEFIPGGVGDLIGAYNDFNSGDYFSACMGIVLAAVPFDEVRKVWKHYPEIRKGFKACYKIVILWNKLFSLPGGQKVLSKMPQAWKSLPGSKLQKDLNSLKWTKNPGHHFRLSDKKPTPKWENDKYPYAQFFKGNDFYDINKNKVPLESNAAHIKINELTDEFLDWFFQ